MKSNKEEVPTFYPVNEGNKITQLKGYQIVNIVENAGNDGMRSTIIILKRELPEGGFRYRDLMLCTTDNQFISDEY